jgi:exodeoxyribonuclease III
MEKSEKKEKKEERIPKKHEKNVQKPKEEKNETGKKEKIRSRTNSLEKPEKAENNKNSDLPAKKEIKIIHWNVNGLRPLLSKEELDQLVKNENPDIVCFNEIKIDQDTIKSLDLNKKFNDKYKFNCYWNCSTEKKGYAGTAILSKEKPESITYGMNIKKHDSEGRVITAEYKKFYLVSCYTPNAGEKLKRIDYRTKEWDSDFFEYINSLKSKKDVIVTGDLNVARNDMDIFEPKGKDKLPGFTKQEKESFQKFLDMGYIDTFRDLHPEEKKYSFFSKRTKGKESNKGWRLDYFVVNKDAKNIEVKESDMTEKDKYNASDHIPIFLTFNLKE